MLSKLSAKYKFFLLLASLLVALIICYQIAFKGTFDMIKQVHELKNKAEIAEDMPAKTSALTKQIKEINSKYFNQAKSQLDAHAMILDQISSLTNSYPAKLVEFPSQFTYQSASVEVETHSLLLSGRFSELLHVLYDMETNSKSGRIVSASFFSEKDYKTKTSRLYCKLYIQNYRNLKDYEK